LTASGLVKVKIGSHGGRWLLTDNGLVGAARISDVELRIAPKIPIPRLLFLLGYAQSRIIWRPADIDAGDHPDLLPAIAHTFARQADRVLQQGLLLGYRVTEESSSVVRGRIREADQIRRRYGMFLPVEIRYDDYTIDIPENRLIAGAAVRLLRLPGVADATKGALRRLLLRLDGVAPLVFGAPLPQWNNGSCRD
jgi:5-methylcytosine-specific restriction enzyme subunit McrC